MEKSFIRHMVATGDKTYSATKAGYSYPEEMGRQVAARPAVQAEIAAMQTAILFEKGLPAAVGLLIRNVTDPKVAPGAANQAAKIILDNTLGRDGNGDRREPHEMSGDELAREIERLKREVSERAKPVTLEHEASPTPGLFD